MGVALALAERGRGRTYPNPNVGCVIIKHDTVIGRGWTQPGGRPHAEGMALAEAGDAARGATAFVTLEPCAHASPRGPACAPSLAEAGVKRVVAALGDPDPRTCGYGFHALREAGVIVIEGVRADDARRSMAGFLTRQRLRRPHVTLKLAVSLDGCIALANGESRWITGAAARAHVHVERARHDAILVGRGTFEADAPRLDVRLPGLEGRSPLRALLSTSLRHPRESGGPSPDLRASGVLREMDSRFRGDDEKSNGNDEWTVLPRLKGRSPRQILLSTTRHPGESRGPSPDQLDRGDVDPGFRRDDDWVVVGGPADIATLPADNLFVEGGAQTAASFLKAGLVDRLLLYTAPILIGGKPALGDLGLADLAAAHGRWALTESRMLGVDRLQVYERA